MRRILLSTTLSLLAITVSAQDKYVKIPISQDPSYEYIRTYMPEYYYEGHLIDDDPNLNINFDRLSVRVRILRNHIDDKTFSYYLLRIENEWDTIFIYEIDSLIAYLERVLILMETKPNDNNYYIYNSQRGFFFKTQWTDSATNPNGKPPYYMLELTFPDGATIEFTHKKTFRI